jgi:multiple antibiotic resistance protein
MENALTLFIGTFTTLLAVINPLESLPIFLKLLAGQDETAHKKVARQSCIYATLLTFFFLVFGTLVQAFFRAPQHDPGRGGHNSHAHRL